MERAVSARSRAAINAEVTGLGFAASAIARSHVTYRAVRGFIITNSKAWTTRKEARDMSMLFAKRIIDGEIRGVEPS